MSKGLVTQMEENRKQNISIKIGDHKRMSMNIDPAEEELIRQAEHYVNYVLDGMKRMFAGESVSEQTARTAFQFAKLYLEQQQANLLQDSELKRFEAELDRLLELAPADKDAGAPEVQR